MTGKTFAAAVPTGGAACMLATCITWVAPLVFVVLGLVFLTVALARLLAPTHPPFSRLALRGGVSNRALVLATVATLACAMGHIGRDTKPAQDYRQSLADHARSGTMPDTTTTASAAGDDLPALNPGTVADSSDALAPGNRSGSTGHIRRYDSQKGSSTGTDQEPTRNGTRAVW